VCFHIILTFFTDFNELAENMLTRLLFGNFTFHDVFISTVIFMFPYKSYAIYAHTSCMDDAS